MLNTTYSGKVLDEIKEQLDGGILEASDSFNEAIKQMEQKFGKRRCSFGYLLRPTTYDR